MPTIFYQHLLFYKSHFISSNRHRGAALCRGGGTYKRYGAFLWNQLKGRHVAKSYKGSKPRKSYKKPRDFFLCLSFSLHICTSVLFLCISTFYATCSKSGKCPLCLSNFSFGFCCFCCYYLFPPIYPSHSNVSLEWIDIFQAQFQTLDWTSFGSTQLWSEYKNDYWKCTSVKPI